jgi:hypothetical protein
MPSVVQNVTPMEVIRKFLMIVSPVTKRTIAPQANPTINKQVSLQNVLIVIRPAPDGVLPISNSMMFPISQYTLEHTKANGINALIVIRPIPTILLAALTVTNTENQKWIVSTMMKTAILTKVYLVIHVTHKEISQAVLITALQVSH